MMKFKSVSHALSRFALPFFIAALCTGNVAAQSDEPIKPIPLTTKLDAKKVALGEILFNDKRLSRDNNLSCASCHNLLERGGADGKVLSTGNGGAKAAVNTPTVFNTGQSFRQTWDGKFATLEDLVDGVIKNPKVMGTKWEDVLEKLGKDIRLVTQMKESYATGLQSENIKDAISIFERSLTTPNSRFDKHLRGDKSALNTEEIKGYQLFKNYGCVACHQGVNVGGNMFQTFGVMGDYFAKRGNVTTADLGRFNVTKNNDDKHVFKVPSLRNVALTAPYFHDGSAATLSDAVDVMFKYQLGRVATRQDKDLIVKFLNTLTGEYKEKSLAVADVPVQK